MFCINCGSPLNKSDKECSFCGNEINHNGSEDIVENNVSGELGNYNELETFDELETLDELETSTENGTSTEHETSSSQNKSIKKEDESEGLFDNLFDEFEGVDNIVYNKKPEDIVLQDIMIQDIILQHDQSGLNIEDNYTENDYTENEYTEEEYYDQEYNEDDYTEEKFTKDDYTEEEYSDEENNDIVMVDKQTSNGDASKFLSNFVNKNQGKKKKLIGNISSNPNDDNEFNKFYVKKRSKLKFVIGTLVFVAALTFIIFEVMPMFNTKYKNPYIDVETKGLEKALTSLVDNTSQSISQVISTETNKSGKSKYEFLNFDIDENTLKLFKLPELNQITKLDKNMNVIWDKIINPKEKLQYNDYKINIKNTEFLRLQYLKQDALLKLMVPSVYPKIFLIDTNKMDEVYTNLGLTKDEGLVQPFLDDSGLTSQILVGKNIISFSEDIKKLLLENLSERNVTFNKDVKYSVNDTQVSASKYKINISESKAKIIIKGILTRLSKDEDVYKALVGKYASIIDIIKQLGVDDGKLDGLDKKSYFAYMNDLKSKIDTINIKNGMIASVWVDLNGNVLGRNYEFTIENDKGDSQKVTVYYNYIDTDAKKYSSLDLVCEPKSGDYKSIVLKFETNTKLNLMTANSKNTTDSAKISYGSPAKKDYLSFEVLSDKAVTSEIESKRKYKLDFQKNNEKGNYKMNVSAVGTERGTIKDLKVNGDYNILYDISSTNSYKGKFDLKYDTIYEDFIEIPESPILSKTASTVELNSISEKGLDEIYFDVQVKYKAYQRRIAELFGLKSAGEERLH